LLVIIWLLESKNFCDSLVSIKNNVTEKTKQFFELALKALNDKKRNCRLDCIL